MCAAVALATVLTGACNGDGDGDEAASTTTTTVPFEQGAAKLELNIAATGLSTVATDVALRSARGEGAAYCRSTAEGELVPHESTLKAATDAEVRRHAEAALADLHRAIDACAGGAEIAAVNEAIAAYNDDFSRLRSRIDSLP